MLVSAKMCFTTREKANFVEHNDPGIWLVQCKNTREFWREILSEQRKIANPVKTAISFQLS